jgi:glycosyltransferase involved in cell wall biosynthesis
VKIAVFSDAYWPRINGLTVAVDSFCKELAALGHEVVIICPRYDRIKEGAIEKVPVDETHSLTLIRVPSRPMLFSKEDRTCFISKARWVYRLVDEFSPDIVHIHSEYVLSEFGHWYAISRNKKSGHKIPVFYTFHTLWEEYVVYYTPFLPKWFSRWVISLWRRAELARSDVVIAPTPQINEVIASYKMHTKTAIIPTGIEPALFSHSAEEASLYRRKLEEIYPALKGKDILLYAGRMRPEKNLEFLLELMPKLLEEQPNTVLLMVGDGAELPALKHLAKKLKLEDKCIFTGYMGRAELSLAYSISALFLFPSKTETQGLVTLEAFASGIPVVAMGCMGTKAVMQGSLGGFMVEPTSPAQTRSDFIDCINRLLNDKALYTEKCKEAKEAVQNWTIKAQTARLVDEYAK